MSKKRKKESGEPTWVKHPVHGWLPDEAPLFDVSNGRGRVLRLGLGGCYEPSWYNSSSSTLCLETQHYDGGWFNSHREGHDSARASIYRPLTTAARELLAALKAERGE